MTEGQGEERMELKTQAQEGQNGQLSAVGAVLDLKTGLEGHGGEWARGVGGGREGGRSARTAFLDV